eukprot:Skav235443  [mRNA]  locus=scaffold2206:62305:65715:- [translate_table: standard]
MALSICLPSGRSASVSFDDQMSLAEVKALAQQQLDVGFLRLMSADGRLLDPMHTVVEAGVKQGDTLTGVVHYANVAATSRAFAIFCEGLVVTWGQEDCGGDKLGFSTSWTKQQCHITALQSSQSAFAAILDDGAVMAWGNAAAGGDCSLVKPRLNNVVAIQATDEAFAAIRADGSVVCWGSRGHGGDGPLLMDARPFSGDTTLPCCPWLPHVARKFQDAGPVRQLQSTQSAFAAICQDGSVRTWGSPESGGATSWQVQHALKHVTGHCQGGPTAGANPTTNQMAILMVSVRRFRGILKLSWFTE